FTLLDHVFPTAKGIRLLGVMLSSLGERSSGGGGQLRLEI
ncbi:MAG: DNA polymerase IV, partial [Sphingomonas hengshuiensis]